MQTATDPRKSVKISACVFLFNPSPDSASVNIGSGENVTFDSTDLAPGKYTVTGTVSDGKYSANCTETVTVLKKNVAPVASIEPASGNITQGDTLPMRCIASDANNDPLTYSWTVNGQPLAANVNSITFGTEGRKPGGNCQF